MYHQSLPAKSEAVSNQWEQVKQGDFDPELCLQLQNMMHKLAGSAGMYGYDSLAKKAREVEGALMSGVDTSAAQLSTGSQIEEFIVMLDVSFADGIKTNGG